MTGRWSPMLQFRQHAGENLEPEVFFVAQTRLIPLTQVRLYIVAMPAFQNRRAALAAARADEAVRPAPFE